MAFGDASAGADGQVWTTFSQIGPFKFGIVFASELKSAYSLTPEKAGFKDDDVKKKRIVSTFVVHVLLQLSVCSLERR